VPPNDATIEVALTVEGAHTELVVEVKGIPLDVVAFYEASAGRSMPRTSPTSRDASEGTASPTGMTFSVPIRL
jgi:hypothetical protein